LSRKFPAALTLSAVCAAGVFTVNADNASGSETPDGELVIDLRGDVEVTDGDIFVTSDSGRVWQNSGRAVFFGDVVVVADTITASADRLEYDRSSGTAVLTGHAVLEDGESRLTASQVTFFRLVGKAVASGGVVMTGPWLGHVTGEYALYDQARGTLFVTIDPALRRAEGSDSLLITADRLEFLPDSDRAEAQGNARLDAPGRDMTASAELLRFHGLEDRVELMGSPVMSTPDGELAGNYMEAFLDGGELTSLRVEGAVDGHMVDSEVSPPGESWFTSQRAWFGFAGGSPDSVDLSGAVTLTIRSGGEAAERQESNTVSGEHLTVRYSGGSPDLVTVSGTVRGTYSYRKEGGG
jgi:lipopolysaccharide export system protein LptA